ncbi:ABC transporter permease [uncultured Imperialibacter sp.]|uniref:ABC transporter permease n=1 Tax=uncultured Imperialibacter sp. TaxID=1672639 RepID=UPI0030DBCE5F|tara:strand:- start:7765 stop:10188 length:2424 start_codon:yes stop_codon:yes gene_type:complete
MLKNYLKIALRSMARQKLFSFVNIAGLSLAMSVSLLLITIIYNQYNYDRFHAGADRIYRIESFNPNAPRVFAGTASSPLPFKKAMVDQYAYFEAYTNLRSDFRREAQTDDKVLDVNGLLADESFFKVFSFPLMEGHKETALRDPFSVVVTKETAEKFFGKRDSYLGLVLDYTGVGPFKITGVLDMDGVSTHMKFEALGSMSTLNSMAEDGPFSNQKNDNWSNLWVGYNYFKLNQGVDPQQVAATVTALAEENIEWAEDREPYTFGVAPVTKIAMGNMYGNELGFYIPSIVLAFFGFLALVVMVTALFNYTNLSLAKSLTRAREIGIRKVSGATRRQVIHQFVIESVIMAMLSLVLSVGILKMMIPAFNGLEIFTLAELNVDFSYGAFPYFVAFSLLVGLFAGVFPALFLSKFSPIQALKGYHGVSGGAGKRGFMSNFSFKKVLMIVQFGLSIFMIISILVMREQTSLMVNSEYGFDEENLLVVELQGSKPEIVAAELSKNPAVTAYTFSSHNPAIGRSHGSDFQRDMEGERFGLNHFSVDDNYISTFGITLLAGRDYAPGDGEGTEKFIILNETAVKIAGFETSHEAIGQEIILDKENRVQIIGVVKDYHFEPLMKSIEPMALRYMPDSYENINLKISSANVPSVISALQEAWKSIDSKRDLKYSFLDQEMDHFYFFLGDITAIVTAVSLFAIFISCLGLLGMVSFQLQTKVKEIGIKKVLGATTQYLVMSLTRQFSMVIIISVVVFVPIAVLVSDLWLNLMATRVSIGFGVIAMALLIVGCLGLVTIVSQVIKAATANPVNALRNE